MKLYEQHSPEYQDANILTRSPNEKNVPKDSAHYYGSLVPHILSMDFPFCVFTSLINNEGLDRCNSITVYYGVTRAQQ